MDAHLCDFTNAFYFPDIDDGVVNVLVRRAADMHKEIKVSKDTVDTFDATEIYNPISN
jgi:hypothetical protein